MNNFTFRIILNLKFYLGLIEAEEGKGEIIGGAQPTKLT